MTEIEKQIADLNRIWVAELVKIEDVNTSRPDKEAAWNNVDRIVKLKGELIEMLDAGKKTKWSDKIDVNTLISGGISVASLLLILNYEKLDIITSKAFNLAIKR